VIAPASTGRESSSRTAVIKIDHTNRGILSHVWDGVGMLIVVAIKFTAPKIDDAPAR